MAQIKDQIIARVISGIIIAGVLAGGGFVVTHWNQSLLSSLAQNIYLVTACILTASITVLVGKRLQSRKDTATDILQPHFAPLDVDFRVLRKELFYEYKNLERTQLYYCKKVRVKALKHGLECYPDKYHWTARGTLNISSG